MFGWDKLAPAENYTKDADRKRLRVRQANAMESVAAFG